MKELRKEGNHTKLVKDILYVNGRPYDPSTQNDTAEKVDTSTIVKETPKITGAGAKRKRMTSTPDSRQGRAGEHANDSSTCNVPTDKLKILSLNCCGIKQKLNYPEFKNFVANYDILCFQETKTDDLDTLHLDGFEFHMKNRFKCGKKCSGGITLAYKKELCKDIFIHKTDIEFVLWFEISKTITNTDKNIIVGNVYIPPENSKYSNKDVFSLLEIEMQNMLTNNKHVILAGDFNARTGTRTEIHSVLHESMDRFNEIFEESQSEFNLTLESIERNNVDKIQNCYGKLLLEMCKSNNLLIVNGRLGDNISGKVTCKGTSTVDYFICDYGLRQHIDNMQVLEHSSLYSDVHNPIVLTLSKQIPKLRNNTKHLNML